MSEIIVLEAEVRDRAGKGAARATRRAGRIPAVIYGDKKEPVMISLDPKPFGRQLNRAGFFSHLFDVNIDGKKHRVLPRDVQLHPVTDAPLHVDFVRVTAHTKTHVHVPVHFDNHAASPGLKRGGVLNIVRHDIELSCSADSIPERIDIDLTGLEIGDSVHISAIKLPEGAHPVIADRDFTIATIAAPTVKTEDAGDEAAGETPAA
jgi:large subunit ribosomal protein L25